MNLQWELHRSFKDNNFLVNDIHWPDYPNFAKKFGSWNCKYYAASVVNSCNDNNIPSAHCVITSPPHVAACLPTLLPDHSVALVNEEFYSCTNADLLKHDPKLWIFDVIEKSENSYVCCYDVFDNEYTKDLRDFSVPYWYIRTILRAKFSPENEWIRNAMFEHFKSLMGVDYIFCKTWTVSKNFFVTVFDFDLSNLKFINSHELSNEVKVTCYTTDFTSFKNLLNNSKPTTRWSDVKGKFTEITEFTLPKDTFKWNL